MFSNVRNRSFQNFLLYTSSHCNVKHFPTKPLLRTAKLFPISFRKSVKLDKSNHRLVYKLPYISFLAAFMRSKISVPMAVFTTSPLVYFLDESLVSSVIMVLSGSMYCATGVLISKYTANVVGRMYVNKEDEITEVIMSSLNESGRRIDRIHKLEDLINIDYTTKFYRSLGFISIGVENSNIYYRVNIRNCQFVDENACNYVFGFRWRTVVNETSESENKEKVEDIKKLPVK